MRKRRQVGKKDYDWRRWVKDSWAYNEIFRTRRTVGDNTRHTVKPKYVWSLRVTNCPVTRLELDYTPDGDDDNSATLVMIDKSLGYIPGNVRIVSWRAARVEQ